MNFTDTKYISALGKAIVIDIVLVIIVFLSFIAYEFTQTLQLGATLFSEYTYVIFMNNIVVFLLLLFFFIYRASREI